MITRFAPSPTGPLHLGHAFSAMLAHGMANAQGGTFLLRIEDIDQSRARPEWEAQIYDDLTWLGLSWPTPVMRQSDRQVTYAAALDDLWARGLLYACTCSRADIKEALSAPQEGAPIVGPDGLVYPGTCRNTANQTNSKTGPRPTDAVLRLNMRAACDQAKHTTPTFNFQNSDASPNATQQTIDISPNDLTHHIGDVVLARRDMGTSYHLSVVLDDADQGITDVVRGQDLFDATKIHVILQRLLGLQTPTYHHHRLIRDDAGKRLAKRDDARAISKYRADGATPDDIRHLVGLPLHLTG